MNPLILPLLWLLNGLLVLLYRLTGHVLVVLTLLPAGWLLKHTPAEQRPWAWAALGMTILAMVIAPNPVPVWLLVMTLSGALAVSVERFNPTHLHWRILSGLALYALAGLGFAFFTYLQTRQTDQNLLLVQGETYLGILISVAMYGIPLGYLVLLAQTMWAHAPLPGQPAEIINTLRARGRD